jgi:hypothetical protein
LKNFVLSIFALVCLAAAVFAADFTGYIADDKCAAKQGAKAASEKHSNCAAACIKNGSKAVLVTEEGKIYQISNQDKVTEHAGHKVTLSGKLDGETITVENVR